MSAATSALQNVAPRLWLRWPIRFVLWLKRPFLLHRVRRHTLERIEDVPLVVWPDVLNPVVFRTGEWFAVSLRCLIRDAKGKRALDMGTGSGACAIFAARAGCRVTAVDVNPEAVRCAHINVMLNRLEQQVEVREGDLFGPVAGERFDLVLFNPPFFRGQPKTLFDLAWRSVDVLERFAAGLASVLTCGGEALILLSTDGDGETMIQALLSNGFDVSVAARTNLGNEVLSIYRAGLRTP
jgi:release factor glutamine methyltransferase